MKKASCNTGMQLCHSCLQIATPLSIYGRLAKKSILNGNNVQGAGCSVSISHLVIAVHSAQRIVHALVALDVSATECLHWCCFMEPFNILECRHSIALMVQSYEGKHHLRCTFLPSFWQLTTNLRGRGYLI